MTDHLSFERAAAFSFAIHVAALLVLSLAARMNIQFEPEVYTVELVMPDHAPSPEPPRVETPGPDRLESTPPPQPLTEPEPAPEPEPVAADEPAPSPAAMADYAASREVLATRSRQMAEQKAAYRRKLAAAEAAAARETAEAARAREIERLRQEQARQAAIERIRQEQARGAEMDRIRRLAAEQAARASSATSQAEMDQARREYALKIEALILENFVFPETVPATTQSTVDITVLRDGTIRINGFETPSGNRIFDRAALSAITKTGTVPAPPFGKEMPLGVNFGRKEIR